jgi:hypothetical protein
MYLVMALALPVGITEQNRSDSERGKGRDDEQGPDMNHCDHGGLLHVPDWDGRDHTPFLGVP